MYQKAIHLLNFTSSQIIFSLDYLVQAYHDCSIGGIKNLLGLYHFADEVSEAGVVELGLYFVVENVRQSILPQFRMEYGLRGLWSPLY